MADIYALQGIGGTGKTETIRFILDQLRLKYPNAQVTNLRPQRRRDVAFILDGANGKKVGIESQGDPNSALQTSLQNFMNVNCDVIFCATRTSGMTVNWVNAYAVAGHQVRFVQQTIANANYSQLNRNMAAHLITLAGL